MDQIVHFLVATAWPLAFAALLSVVTALLLNPKVGDAITALGHKLAAQTEQLVAQSDAQNNQLLTLVTHAAMTYAEVHQASVLRMFDSKADYVIAAIQKDPRFSGTGVTLEAIKHTIEQLWVTYFADLKLPAPKAPADTPPTGPPLNPPPDIPPTGPPAPPGN